ncbi:MAG: hypothetical protein V1816_09260 [Pseudomonadota bacterium]
MMKRKSWVIPGMVLVVFYTLFLAAGCGSSGLSVKLDYGKYVPDLKAELSDYSGKSMTLLNMVNDAENSAMWGYYSPDGKMSYVTDWPETYFWYMFQRAILSAGTTVFTEDNRNPNSPAVLITLKSLSSEAYTFKVDVGKGISPAAFTKDFTIKGPPISEGEPNLEQLENRAYEMTSMAVLAIFQDPEFKAAFMAASE